ncbi:MAG: A/G-specific adenine glycosylase [Deltaproteobacteria bacterium]|nr:A/G-specific adenine glycosylase [Deltaproteobacteria bacterium]
MSCAPIADALKRRFRTRLLRWFAQHGRALPWRETRDPYKILVSEVMLQQTQVDRVREFYPRFLKKYPSVESLARARPLAVREAWDGLGYYARARNLHAASRAVVKNHDGRFPRDATALQQLPGIGRYTAGAVASFAHAQRAPIVDTNVARVLARVFGLGADVKRSAVQKQLWHLAETLLPRKPESIWAFNQGIMDLGATVCTARKPQCPACPLRGLCLSAKMF